MKKLLLLLPVLMLAIVVNAQQDPQYSQNSFINPVFNPGASGIKENHHCFDALFRQQWVGFDGAPTTAMLSYNGNFPDLIEYQSLGFGGVFVYDQIGLETNVFFKANGAYHLPLGQGKLGLGMDIGFMSKQIGNDILAADMNDPNVVGLAGSRSLNFDLGLGAFYYIPRKFYAGLSGQKLIPQKITWNNAEPKIRPHSFLTFGYYQRLNQDFYLIPSGLVKTDWTSAQLDVNVLLEYQEQFWGGVSYRYQDAVVAMVGGNMSIGKNNGNLKVGFAYDFTTSNIRNPGTNERFTGNDPDGARQFDVNTNNRSIGSVEIYLGYCFIKPPKPMFKEYVDPMLPFDVR